MKKVTALELRKRAQMILREVSEGASYQVTYRGKPMAELKPPARPKRPRKDDPFFRLVDAAKELPGSGSLTNEEIDRILYAFPELR
jgi:antitoxin (DNA-binding transcriptional repressor) of toxin-antitoxin stability system